MSCRCCWWCAPGVKEREARSGCWLLREHVVVVVAVAVAVAVAVVIAWCVRVLPVCVWCARDECALCVCMLTCGDDLTASCASTAIPSPGSSRLERSIVGAWTPAQSNHRLSPLRRHAATQPFPISNAVRLGGRRRAVGRGPVGWRAPRCSVVCQVVAGDGCNGVSRICQRRHRGWRQHAPTGGNGRWWTAADDCWRWC